MTVGSFVGATLLVLGLSGSVAVAGDEIDPAEPSSAVATSSDELPDPAEIERLRREVDELKGRLATRQQDVSTAETEAERLDLLVELLGHERSLVDAEWRKAHRELVILEREIASARAVHQDVLRRLGRRLSALYRVGRGGVIRLLVGPRSSERLASARALAHLIRRDQRLAAEIARTEEHLEVQSARRERVREAVEGLVRRRSAKEEEIREARDHQSIVAEELERERKRLARRLEEAIERTGRLERLVDLVLKARRSTALEGESPRKFRGALAWPVEGSVRTAFGRQRHPEFGTYVVNKGIEIEAAGGTSVRTVYPGTVLYARQLKGYGNVVILDHGDRVLTVTGHLGPTSVREGDKVRMNGVVGSVADGVPPEPASAYFEIREAGEAVDPMEWLRAAAARGAPR